MLQVALAVHYPVSAQKDYELALGRLTKVIYQVLKDDLVNNRFKASYNQAIRRDSFNDDFQELITFCEIKITIKLKDFIKKILSVAEEVNTFNAKSVVRSFSNMAKGKTLGINLKSAVSRDIRAMWVSENVRLIKSIGQNALKDVEQVVYASIRQGNSYQQLASNLVDKFKIAKKRALLIARDQIGKLNADLTRARHRELGIDLFKWSTSGDERVRPSHKALNAKVCKYSDVNLYKNQMDTKHWLKRAAIGATLSQPGQEVLCRCAAQAIIAL